MNDLEDRVRSVLHGVADNPGLRTMPSITRGHVRRRQARFAASVTVLTVFAVASGSLLLQSLPRGQARDPSADGYTSQLEVVPAGWPVVDIGDPADAYIPFPDSDFAVGRKDVIASGTVEGAPFSLVGFLTNDSEGPGCFEYAPPWNGQPGSAGVMGACVGSPDISVPDEADLDLLGFSTEPNGNLEANMGFVSPRVERLSVLPDGGSAFPIPILQGPDAWDADFFLVFFFEGIEGDIVAYDAGGTELARSSLCAVIGHSGGCRGGLEQIATLRGPLTWPVVAPAADRVPYVARMEVAPVIGDKRPMVHGEVSTPGTDGAIAFSLVSWTSGGDAEYPAGLCLDLFVGFRASESEEFAGQDPVAGGTTACVGDFASVLHDAPVHLVASEQWEGSGGRALYAAAGITAPGVVRVMLVADGEQRDLELGLDVDDGYLAFVAFVPLDEDGKPVGRLVALNEQMEEVWSANVNELFA